jgi:putative endonuclease
MDNDKYFVYVLELSNGKKYVGQTNNLQRRLEEHRSGRGRFTRKYKVIRLLYMEQHNSRSEAIKRERYLKSGQGRTWLKQKLMEQSASGGFSSI